MTCTNTCFPLNTLFKLFFISVLILISSASFAQEVQDDPYKKPQIWKKLRTNPNDSTLWALYLGKKWSAMTKAELEEIGIWKQELYIQSIAEKEAILGAREREEDLFKETPPTKAAGTNRPVKSEMQMKQLATLESQIMQERSDIVQLKKNIYENFVIIEDALKEEFAKFNVTYRYYDDVHADRKYNEIKWIEEQEARLRKLKLEKVAELRKQVGLK
ncbi:hypothetical protein SAMN04488541_101741 [Thermoflexibacter ruber]|uniref:Uncharacterized protein n=1 Tax=Thermoflexibacter ruber TaxID=1003 RepID=A0A1I2G8S7_9BACT|nr:hypothetical protein SAMN04488541_101741 [Thermoflexibacter ruber]